MSRKSRAECLALVVRDLARLGAATELDRATDRTRTLPRLSPAVLWRILPRLYRATADAGEEGGELTADQATFLRNLAGDIEGSNSPALVVDGTGAAVGGPCSTRTKSRS